MLIAKSNAPGVAFYLLKMQVAEVHFNNTRPAASVRFRVDDGRRSIDSESNYVNRVIAVVRNVLPCLSRCRPYLDQKRNLRFRYGSGLQRAFLASGTVDQLFMFPRTLLHLAELPGLDLSKVLAQQG